MWRQHAGIASTLAIALAALACAGGPATPRPDESVVYGKVRLVPRAGVALPAAGGAYGDRRLRGVELVDYSRTGFVVVYLEGLEPVRRGRVELTIRSTGIRPDLTPTHAALGAGDVVHIVNRSDSSHVLSCPRASIVQRLAPGEAIEIALPEAGVYELFLLDVTSSGSRIFAAPGPYTVVSDSGRYELISNAAGRRTLRTWHPRLPPTSRMVDLTRGEVTVLDLKIGVGQMSEAHDAPR